MRRELSDDYASGPVLPGRRFSGLRFRLRGGVPTSTLGRVVSGAVILGGLAGFTAVLWGARSMLMHDSRLNVVSSSAVQITGNDHLTRGQLLSIFGEDVDRNILTISLEDRREQLETLPWVEHATVMRLMPNRLRVAIVERTPVAFVRQGNRIGLVDRTGVLLDLSPDMPADEHYSFPVVTGVSGDDPLSVRAARMALFTRFTSELDAGADKVSKSLSEVDLSSPEDVKALIPSEGSEVLVHFGEDDFLARYQRYEKNLPGWKQQYPKLASVDMRYEHNVVLEMKPGSAVPAHADEAATAAAAAAPVGAAKGRAGVVHPVAHPVVKKVAAGGKHLRTAFAVSAKKHVGAR